MNRNFYFYGNLFLGLGVACSAIFSITYLFVGPGVLGLGSFVGWLIVWTLISLAGALFLLKYYHHKKYLFAFVSGSVVVVANLLVSAVLLTIMLSRELQSIYVPTILFSIGVGLIHSMSLIFSSAGKSPWLKTVGILMLAMGVVYGSVVGWSMDQMAQVHAVVTKVDQWTWLLRSFIPILFMIQFSREGMLLKPEAEQGRTAKFSENFFGIAGMLAFVATLGFGGAIAKDGIGSVHWGKVNAARAQRLVEMSETRIYRNKEGDTLRYLLTRPLNYDPQIKYPLVVCLPYSQFQSPPADWLAEQANREKYPAFLLVPLSQPGTSWGGVPESARRIPLDDLVYQTLMSLNEPAVDDKRIYIAGVSLGGYGSWHLICEHPEVFAAAIPVCGAGDPAMAWQILNVAVWAFHGAKDVGVPVSGSRDMIAAMKKAGAEPKYTEFGHLGHNIWHEVSKTPGLLDWLFSQKRE